MKKFLLVGGYCCGNPGDEAILKSTVYTLAEMHPDAFFYIWSDRQDFEIRFDREIVFKIVQWRPFLFRENSFFSRIAIRAYIRVYPLSRRWNSLFNGISLSMEEALENSDEVIFVGGGYLNSFYALAEMNRLAMVFEKRGKRVYLLGQTLGPFLRRSHRMMADEILNSAEQIVLREEHSLREVEAFRSKVAVSVDDAFGFEPRPALDPKNESGDTVNVGLSLRRWQGSRNFYAEIAVALQAFGKSLGGKKMRVFFIPMETSGHCDDRLEGREFQKLLSGDFETVLLEEPMTVEEKFRLIQRMDLLIGMRLHALVFSLSTGTPCIGIYQDEYYFRKITGLMRPFGLAKFAIPPDGIRSLPALLGELNTKSGEWRQKILKHKNKALENRARFFRRIATEKDKTMKISVIIPTLNRPEDVKSVLTSLARQTYQPLEAIVIDQSTDNQTKEVVAEVAKGIPAHAMKLKYVVQEEKSLVQARNRGVELASGSVVSFLDDDVVLHEEYFENIVHFLKENPRIGAVSGNTLLQRRPSGWKWEARKFLMRLFLLSNFKGRMTLSGFGYPIYEREIQRPVSVGFLPGCNMNFRRQCLEGESFDKWFTGYGFREDVDFTYRISKKTRMAMIPEAKLLHNYSLFNRMDEWALKKLEVKNYFYVFHKFKGKNPLAFVFFAYSLAGIILIDFLEFLCSLNLRKLRKLGAGIDSSFSLFLGKEALR